MIHHYRTWESLAEMIRRISSARGRRQTGLYSIEGLRLVERAVRAGAPLEQVLIGTSLAGSTTSRAATLLDELNTQSVGVMVAPDEVMAELTEGRDLGAMLGVVRLPEPAALDTLLASQPDRHTRLLAAIDIVDPGNVGALLRTAHAGGAAALLTTGVSDPFHPRAIRISRGSIFKLPVIQYGSAEELTASLTAFDVMSAGATLVGGVALPEIRWPEGPVAIMMGNEAEGLAPALRQQFDIAFTIPMAPGIDSYSVNAAAAIALYSATTWVASVPGR